MTIQVAQLTQARERLEQAQARVTALEQQSAEGVAEAVGRLPPMEQASLLEALLLRERAAPLLLSLPPHRGLAVMSTLLGALPAKARDLARSRAISADLRRLRPCRSPPTSLPALARLWSAALPPLPLLSRPAASRCF